MLVSRVAPERRDIPHEPGEWFEFRPVSHSQLRSARRLRQGEQMDSWSRMFTHVPPETLQALQPSEKAQDVEGKTGDVADDYDAVTLLSAAVSAWSYGDRVNRKDIEDLDDRTAVWAVREYFGLFTRDEETKKGSGVSSSSITATSTPSMDAEPQEAIRQS